MPRSWANADKCMVRTGNPRCTFFFAYATPSGASRRTVADATLNAGLRASLAMMWGVTS